MNQRLIAALRTIIIQSNAGLINAIYKELQSQFFPELEDVTIKIANHATPKWLGRAYSTEDKNGKLTSNVIELQKAILGNEKTLRRVLAHELIHSWEYQSVPRKKRDKDGHGKFFLEQAAIINKKLGADFVTPLSDQDYEWEVSKPYHIVIQPHKDTGKFGVTKFVRPTSDIKEEITKRVVQQEAHVFKTKDRTFTNVMTIKKYEGYNLYKDEAIQEKLKKIYESEKPLDEKFIVKILGIN